MRIYTGTSGFSYKEWKGSFYPEKLPAKEMLAYYAERLTTVEINNTFYRMPQPNVLENWAAQVPEDFRFVLKAPRRITHFKRLKETTDETDYFLETASVLGLRLGVLLFQLPPNFKKDLERLQDFLESLPPRARVAMEFRNDTWFDHDVYEALRAHNAALCLADTEESDPEAKIAVSTADWGYLRLRRMDYDRTAVERWVEVVEKQDWEEAFVFFKHEDAGAGPRLASQFAEIASG